jgi:hypothetical protein
MDGERFDDLTRIIGSVASRRTMLLGLAVSALIAPLLGLGMADAAAKKRHLHKKSRRKKKRKIKRNEFGCVDIGKFCKKRSQCCSGICKGKKDKKACKAHDTGNCPAGVEELFCNAAGADVECVTSDGTDGLCDTTTGKAPFCIRDGDCFPCTKDADCVPVCGEGAACIVCPDCIERNGEQTACASSSATGCSFPP